MRFRRMRRRAPPPGRRGAGERGPVRLRADGVPQRARATGARHWPVLLLPQARESRRGATLERGLPAGRGVRVSRTPVREALRRLAALGLVSLVPNRGVRVRTLSSNELYEA